jgi:lipoate-protein ligase B
VVNLGIVEYKAAWELQQSLAGEVAEGLRGNLLLLLEHPHVYTLGRRGRREDIGLTDEELERLGIQMYEVDRGGEVAYHGPGQLVAYPIVNLHTWGGPVKYVRTLEQVIIMALKQFHIQARTLEGLTGVWVGGLEPPSPSPSPLRERGDCHASLATADCHVPIPKPRDGTRNDFSPDFVGIEPLAEGQRPSPLPLLSGEREERVEGREQGVESRGKREENATPDKVGVATTIVPTRSGQVLGSDLSGHSPVGGEEKIAAIGVKVSRGVTYHGFALNVNTDLKLYRNIVPCGIKDRDITSMSKLLSRPVEMELVSYSVTYHFGQAFGFRMEQAEREVLSPASSSLL